MISIQRIGNTRAVGLALSVVVLFAGCGTQTETRTDPEGWITYEMPVGWSEVPASGHTRFRPTTSPDAVEIQVNTMRHNPRHTIEEERGTWLDFQRQDGQKVLRESTWDRDGFHVVEFAHTGEGLQGATVWHQVIMQQRDYKVVAYLMAPADQYEALDPVFRKVIDSVRPIQ